jgi:hypothetical protein
MSHCAVLFEKPDDGEYWNLVTEALLGTWNTVHPVAVSPGAIRSEFANPWQSLTEDKSAL